MHGQTLLLRSGVGRNRAYVALVIPPLSSGVPVARWDRSFGFRGIYLTPPTPRCSVWGRWGIYLTPPTPRCSVWGHERGFPANIAGVGTAFQQRGGVRRIPRNAALAERMVLSTVRGS